MFDDEAFRRKAGQLQAALKAHIKPENRERWGMADRTELAQETGLPEFFVYDAIDSGLLGALFGTIDAEWGQGDAMKNWIDIPPRRPARPIPQMSRCRGFTATHS